MRLAPFFYVHARRRLSLSCTGLFLSIPEKHIQSINVSLAAAAADTRMHRQTDRPSHIHIFHAADRRGAQSPLPESKPPDRTFSCFQSLKCRRTVSFI